MSIRFAAGQGGEDLDSKNRLVIALAITCLIVVAIFTSFGRSLFFVQIPSITLSDTSENGSTSSQAPDSTENNQYWQVVVTPETVQSIVATLSRPDSYYRELTVETLWSEGSYTSTVQYWEDSGWSHVRQTLPSGAVRHDLIGPETSYYWYEGSSSWISRSADQYSADLAQRIPTYETVLSLDPDSIIETGYELRGSYPCVYVEVQSGENRLERYWISTGNGLLISAEPEVNGSLVYRMTAYSPIQSPCPATASFSLPDGQELHSIS